MIKDIYKEPLIATLGVFLAGIITIPFAGKLSGVEIDTFSAMKMGFIFATGRFFWLLMLRIHFAKLK